MSVLSVGCVCTQQRTSPALCEVVHLGLNPAGKEKGYRLLCRASDHVACMPKVKIKEVPSFLSKKHSLTDVNDND